MINVGLSDHQFIYCIKKITRTKTGGVQKELDSVPTKNYVVDAYKNALRRINFPNYEYFEDVQITQNNHVILS